MKLRWRATLSDGSVRLQDRDHWLHLDHDQLAKLEIIDEAGAVKFATSEKPIDRRYRVYSDGKGNVHVIHTPLGVTFVSERDGSVRMQRNFGGPHGHAFDHDGREEFLAKHPKPQRS